MESNDSKYKAILKKAANKIEELTNIINEKNSNEQIAVIGYSCRFPGGASNPEKFWELLANGVDTVTEIKESRFDYKKYYNEDIEKRGKMITKNASFLEEDIKEFDNVHFEISGIEAKSIDPQHRLLLEVSWEAMENSALNIEKLKGSRTGVFIAISSFEYGKKELFSGDVNDITPYSTTGILNNCASGRLSYFYDFKGPSITCDTACSSSIVALNAAIESLRNNQCNMAIVGGVNLLLEPENFIGLSKFGGLSKDGRCKAFDNSADGFGRAEGCGVVILKRLKDAKEDENKVLALVKAVAIGQDGRSNGFSAPNGISQQNLIKQALRNANLNIDDIDYIETHGTGTSLGDHIEAQSISEVFKSKKNKILIGAVKSNIGHLEAAAGMASLIKVLLSIEKKQIPPSIHFNEPNHNINWNKIEVVNKLIDWEKNEGVKRAGISSFGFSGTLGHAIIEEAPKEENNLELNELPYHIMTISAKNEKALKDYMVCMKEYLIKEKKFIGDISYTTNISRSSLKYKYAITGRNKEDFIKKLEEALSETDKGLNMHNNNKMNHKIAFLFTGQGSVYKDIAKDFYSTSKEFRDCLDLCNEKFGEILGISLVNSIYGDDDKLLDNPIYSQPAIFSIEYALTKVWDTLGVRPNVILGHSIGEYVAACYGGLISLDDAIMMIAQRGKLMSSIDIDGKMVGVLTNVNNVKSAIEESCCKNVSIAAINAPNNVTISGISNEVDEVVKIIQSKEKVFINKLNIAHPYHSIMMKNYTDRYNESIGNIQFLKLNINMISSISGNIEKEELLGQRKYWMDHLCNTVNYQAAIESAKKLGVDIFIEIGGDATLTGLANQCLEDEEKIFIPTLRKGLGAYNQLLNSVAELYLNNVEINWKKFYKNYKKNKIVLPNYCFNRKRLWADSSSKNKNSDGEDIREVQVANKTKSNENVDGYNYKEAEITNNVKLDIELEKIKSKNVEDIKLEIKSIIAKVAELDMEEINEQDNLLSLGFDSLLLMNFKNRLSTKYNIDISLNEFFLELNTVELIANHVYNNMPKEELSKEVAETIDSVNDDFSRFMEQQIKDINKQLRNIVEIGQKKYAVKEAEERKDIAEKLSKTMLLEEDNFDKKQIRFIQEFVSKYNNKTKKSKAYAESNRKQFCDWLNSVNFRKSIKELFYPIVLDKAQGEKIWDIDGNEYIDLAIGYGAHYFGHNQKFLNDAVKEQLEKGFVLAPQCDLAGKVASLITELTGVDRVAFCNTGSEAVMVALRIARAYSKKNKIVKFAGSYHGTFDGVLADTDENGPFPTSRGTTYGTIKDTITLFYGSNEALEYIRNNKDEIAAVLVEPVQSRRPSFQPKEFLKELRELTENENIILIFDEMVNGFRIEQGGAQAYFGIKADIVTYGKIVGGGLPIGVVCGKEKYIDYIDGGKWEYGDETTPKDETVTFAGTFCKHPLTMATAYATLSYMKKMGNELQHGVNERTRLFAERANKFFENEKVPVRVQYFGSQFKFDSYGKYSGALFPIEMDLFFYILAYKGIYTWERRTCCFCTEITNEDIDLMLIKIEETIRELRAGGFEFTEEVGTKSNVWDMSLIQQRLYTQTLLSDKDPYNVVSVYRVKGKLDITKFEDIVNTIIKRHESLRTRFYIEEGLKQEVLENINFRVRRIQKEDTEALDKLIRKSIRTFDLSKAPLFEVVLISIKEDEEIIIFNFHHTIADGMSMNIFVQEFIRLYSNERLKPLNRSYRDFVAWEKKYLESDDLKSSEKYWLNKLSGDISKLMLPVDYNSKSGVSTEANTVKINIDNKTVSNLKLIAKENACSLFMILIATFSILLKRLSGSDDILIGTPVTNRGEGLFDENIGMFTNTIVLRNNPEEQKEFKVFLNEVKQNCVEAYSNMYYPFNLLVNNINKNKDDELINVMFIYENVNERIFKAEELEVSEYDYKVNKSDFNFIMEVLEGEGSFNINLTYKTSLFKETTIKRWGEYYKNILSSILKKKDQKIKLKDIDLIGDEERYRLLAEFNNTEVDYLKDKTIVDLFEEQVEKTPNNIAVVCEGKELTYKELNEKANGLAKALRAEGIKPDNVVGIMLERSLDMIISIMGVLKSGGAYLPIDEKTPKERVLHVLRHSNSKVLISKSHLSKDLKYDGKLININKLNRINIAENLDKTISSNNLAYVIYTSGTTGSPKGVMIEHRQVNNFICGVIKRTNINKAKAILCITTISFDIFGLETLLPLTNGMKVVIAKENETIDPYAVENLILENEVEIMQTTPSRMKLFMEDGKFKKSLEKLKLVLVGGEQMPSNLAEELIKFENLEIYNMYGPTETTIWSTIKKVESKDLTIGKPIQNTKIYILNKDLNIQPIGVVGELCISGDGVGRGYLNNEELTSEKFIDNPFEQGKKLYKTGDLAKWQPDGEIDFIGRVDYQVKIRGYRIELSEVESKLLEISGIKESVVIVKVKDESKYLCAYYVSDNEYSVSELREELKKSLPEYMIPSYFIRMEVLSLNTSGKIDRKFLPEPDGEINIDTEYEAPRDELEEKLVEIWSGVLDVDNIGINHNFFELGGHSLKATILIGRIHKELNVEVPLKVIFDVENIKGLSEYIRTSDKKEYEEIKKVEEKENYEVSSAQKRMYIMQEVNKDSTVYNMSQTFEIIGKLEMRKVKDAFIKLIKRHEALRTSFHSMDDNIVQKINLYEEINFEVQHFEAATSEEVKTKIQNFIKPFNLEVPPLLRVGIISLEEERHLIIFDIHHIIADGTSIAILTREFNELYAGIELQELNIQYKDYSSWQLKKRESGEFKKQEEYWLKEFEGPLPVLNMPTDFARQDAKDFSGDSISFVLDRELTNGLRKIAKKTGSTLYMVLLSSINVLLSKYSGQEDIIVGSPIAGRNHRDLENVVGMFVNTLALRSTVNSELAFNDYLKSVKEKVIKSYENQDYQFDDLVEKVCKDRDLSRNPLFDIFFVFQNMNESQFEAEGLIFKAYASDNNIEKFDITILIKEISDELSIDLIYSVRLFKGETIKAVKHHLIDIIKYVVKDPTIKLKDINISQNFNKVKKMEYNKDFNF